MKYCRLLALLFVFVLGVVACAGDGTDTAAPEPGTDDAAGDDGDDEGTEPSDDPIRVGMAIAGPPDDGGFYQGHYDGLNAAADAYGLDVSIVENVEDPQAQLDAIRNLAADGNELVIGGSSAFSDPAEVIAPQFPDTTFIVSAGVLDDPGENLHAYFVRQGTGSYVVGAVAAALTDSNIVGFIGGVEIPPTIQAEAGFQAGVLDADSGIDYRSTMIGTFNDPAAAKEAAEAQIAAGADVIYTFINAATPGVFQAIEESGQDIKALVAPAPRCDESDAVVLTKNFDTVGMVDRMVSDYLEGGLPEGTYFFALEDPSVQRVELCSGHEDPDLQEIIDEVTRQINEGEIELPDNV